MVDVWASNRQTPSRHTMTAGNERIRVACPTRRRCPTICCLNQTTKASKLITSKRKSKMVSSIVRRTWRFTLEKSCWTAGRIFSRKNRCRLWQWHICNYHRSPFKVTPQRREFHRSRHVPRAPLGNLTHNIHTQTSTKLCKSIKFAIHLLLFILSFLFLFINQIKNASLRLPNHNYNKKTSIEITQQQQNIRNQHTNDKTIQFEKNKLKSNSERATSITRFSPLFYNRKEQQLPFTDSDGLYDFPSSDGKGKSVRQLHTKKSSVKKRDRKSSRATAGGKPKSKSNQSINLHVDVLA